jgi:hypothetical protein
MRIWFQGVVGAVTILAAGAVASLAFAQVHGGNGGPQIQPPRPTPPRPPPRPPSGHRARLELYAQPNFRGRHIRLSSNQTNLGSTGFNDRTMSLRAVGRWRVCEHAAYRGRCLTVHGDQRQIFGLSGRISSVRYEGR